MACLKESSYELASGDPIHCSECQAMLSMHSEIKVEEKLQAEDAMVTDSGAKPTQQVWNCEFCSHKNLVDIEPEEKPKNETVSYTIEAAPLKE